MKKSFCILFFIITSILLTQCAKENIQPKIDNEYLSGRRVRYTIYVASGDHISKSDKSLVGARISLVMNDSVYVEKTDSTGMVTFNNLATGNCVVKINKSNYTTAVYTVDLSLADDSVSNFDTQNLRNSSTIVCLLPLSGAGTAHISGKAFADLDLTTAGYEFVSENTNLSATILTESIFDFLNHNGAGKILSFAFENSVVYSKIRTNGDYSFEIPAASKGLKMILRGDDFSYNQIIAPSVSNRHIFSLSPDTFLIYPDIAKIKDCIFY